ncbi:MAG: SDR family oxidoreductase [Myxococcales bacterium]|nr:SDR family oxidoreductase [Myxococcales bacterium]
MSKNFENKVVLITGGTTGIGFASAKRFAEAGARVIVTGRNPATVEAARQELAGVAEVIPSDAGNEADVRALFAEVQRRHGHIDVLFLNAGIAEFAPLGVAPLAQLDRLWNVNVRGTWLALSESLPLLAEGASVVITTSVVNHKGMPGTSAYAATKAALREIVRVAASELAPRRIRVNALSPGPIETPIYGKLGLSQQATEAFASSVVAQVPLARFGHVDEVARAALFLASEDATYVTGIELDVDGGLGQV